MTVKSPFTWVILKLPLIMIFNVSYANCFVRGPPSYHRKPMKYLYGDYNMKSSVSHYVAPSIPTHPDKMEVIVIEDKGGDHHHHHYYHHYHKHGNEHFHDHDYNHGNSHNHDHIPKSLYNMDQHNFDQKYHQKHDGHHGQFYGQNPTLRHTYDYGHNYGHGIHMNNAKEQHYGVNANPHRAQHKLRHNYDIDDFTPHQHLHNIENNHDSNYGERIRGSVSKYPTNEDERQSYQSSFKNEAASYASENDDMLGYDGFMFKGLQTSTQFGGDPSYGTEPQEGKNYVQNSYPFFNDITLLPIKGLQLSLMNFTNY